MGWTSLPPHCCYLQRLALESSSRVIGIRSVQCGWVGLAFRHTAATFNDSYEDLACFLYIPAAGQPSLAKTLLHRGPAQGTFSRGLMANSLIARYFCTQPIQYNKAPHEELLFYALCPVGVSAGLKTDDHSPKAKNIQCSISGISS